MKIVLIGDVCLEKKDLEALEKIGSVSIYPQTPPLDTETIELINAADIVISALVKLNKNIINHVNNVKLIVLATTGFDDIDLEAAHKKGITVSYTPGYATQAVAEHTVGLMLAASRLSFTAAHDVKKGLYNPCLYEGKELSGNTTLGIIGYGRIGKRVAEIVHAGFGMRIVHVDQHSSRADVENLLRESDIISLHVPLTPQTHHMLSHQEFELIKQGALIINTARGALIDEHELLSALNSGRVFAAGLDVLEHEPMSKDDPLISHPRVMVTPHIAYNTRQALQERSNIVLANVKSYLAGQPQNAL